MNRKEAGKDIYLLSLEISSPVIGDGGNWRCNAVNACGESNANITLNFQGTPKSKQPKSKYLPNQIQTPYKQTNKQNQTYKIQ